MGGGGRMSVLKRAPHSKPPFTLRDIKKAIPPHCFHRSLLRSFSYAVYDLAAVSIFYYIATTFIPELPYSLSYIAWPIYWLCQGVVMTGVWMVAHECGHHSFSDYQWLDDTVGFFLHSAVLTPYFSWKYSHRRHHSNTSSLENEEVYVPKVKSKLRYLGKLFNNPVGRVFILAFQQLLGWPFYLMFNIAGKPYRRFASHFNPFSPIYNDRERLHIAVSDAGVLAVSFFLYRLAAVRGLSWVLSVYGGPLLVMNSFIVLITYLHHTHASLPHYDSSEWDWLRGSLATVDRDFGILSKFFHHISDTHVAHHLFSTIPHYHAMEATKAIKPVLGEYYQIDTTPILKALWREATECIYVESEAEEGSSQKKLGVYWYNNKL